MVMAEPGADMERRSHGKPCIRAGLHRAESGVGGVAVAERDTGKGPDDGLRRGATGIRPVRLKGNGALIPTLRHADAELSVFRVVVSNAKQGWRCQSDPLSYVVEPAPAVAFGSHCAAGIQDRLFSQSFVRDPPPAVR